MICKLMSQFGSLSPNQVIELIKNGRTSTEQAVGCIDSKMSLKHLGDHLAVTDYYTGDRSSLQISLWNSSMKVCGIPSQCGMAFLFTCGAVSSTPSHFLEVINITEQILKYLQYTKAMVTLSNYQHIAYEQFITNDWKVVDTFKNIRTSSVVSTLTKDLTKKEEKKKDENTVPV